MIIFISGSINSGKSSVSKILAEKLGNVAIVEVDELRHFVSWMPLSEASRLSLENAVLLIKNFLNKKIDVVIPYPLSKENHDYLIENLKDYKDKIYFFTLSPKVEIALTNRGSRELDVLEKARIKHHYNNGVSSPEFGTILDNSNETAEETVNKILKILNK